MELLWLKETCDHGEFLQALAELGMKPRKAQYLMAHGRECLAVNRVLDYHPNPAAESKYATVAFLEPPEDPQAIEKLKKDKPHHESEPLNWSAAEAADEVFKIFEKVTERRKVEDMEDVADQLAEKIRVHRESARRSLDDSRRQSE